MINPDFKTNPPLILVVDDEKTLRLVLRRAMEKEGYRVAEASQGEECLTIVPDLQPDMVLLDAMMPGIDGFNCCAQLHQMMRDSCPPILMITVLEDQGSVDLAFASGATDYITKPIHWAVLRQRVRRLLHTRWAIAELKRQVEKERLLSEKLEEANRELRRFASVDGLTQIANRRCFDDYLATEWKRLAREQGPLSLILCDVDFFKFYNDTYGHQAGDECLKKVAAMLTNNAKRPADLPARYGGEEFSVILPNTTSEGAVHVAERIRHKMKLAAIPHSGSLISDRVTMSFGVATMIPNHETTTYQLVTAADKALYQAKMEGRDRVVSASL
ncbi:MAG: diguanylate cyclase domain-containing protein [Chroococcales cyanobacterium]